ncbi:LytR/AlgR family response regulator transcription factor [Mucilaginibacter paludis]|uniref:Two component transcriptional regulator, LytTR family n=1 Tax=Mucilaginibacter paludis DSM 18603 TaxID=714943 RepID=H1YI17_9SPHI|nr:LytTR family DNA-binding domain-containing protein [Mucilaginibacter paludis]EHQ25565.1 two component transcriptional regulator, LytTR family [Mucilaginibacter paludis DSM 18603]
MLNCVIVDDEQFSIEAIKKYIDLVPRLNIHAIFTDPRTALEQVSSEINIDILFMDINMPNISGLELAKALRAKTQKLIFTTAYSKYAFEAFEVEADAYLLKPYTFAKFSTTINRLFPAEMPVRSFAHNGDHHADDNYFLVKNKEEDLRIVKVLYKDVIAFESAHNYIKIHLTSNKILTAYLTIKDIMELLGSREGFKQFHRAFIISTDRINYIDGNTIKMNNNLTFTVGEYYRENFMSYLSNKLFKTSRKR